MNSLLGIILILLTPFGLSAQPIDVFHVDVPYLEHLVKVRIDRVREQHNCTSLVNDSILFLAANHHAQYLFKKGFISHFEEDIDTMRTPQLRADAFGAVNYLVGENVLMTPYLTTIRDKKGTTHNTRVYEGLADAIVAGWVNSPGHYKNIITPEYQITGVAISVNITERKVYACQKFAQVPYVYSFAESKNMFPHSTYVPPDEVRSFEGIDTVLQDHEHSWKLRHDELEKCVDCIADGQQPPFITLRYDRGTFRLRIEDSEYVQQLIRERHDGFAVEIVTFDDYMCGNPEYYLKPSRRNKQCMLNGTVLEPVYRKDLLKGYKKRKVNKGVRFLPFIVGSDSIPFFQRFYQFKAQRYTSEYFEINLGKLPRNTAGYWAHNLVYIQDHQICKVDYFTNYCGELFSDTLPTWFVPGVYEQPIQFVPEQKELSFEIPFRVNQSTFTFADIQPFIDSLTTLTYHVDSIYILAGSSIEGDSVKNDRLQRQRAESIAQVLMEHNEREVPYRIETQTGWDHFYTAVRLHPQYSYLAKASRPEVLKVINGNTDRGVLRILEQERKGIVTLYATIEQTDENCWYFVNRYWDHHVRKVNDPKMGKSTIQASLEQLNLIYEFAHQQVMRGVLDTAFLLKLNIPRKYLHPHLLEKYVLFGHQFPACFASDAEWKKNWVLDRDELVANALSSMCSEFKLLYCKHLVDSYFNGQHHDKEKIQRTLDLLSSLRGVYEENSSFVEVMDNLVYNLNMLLLHDVYHQNPDEFSNDASYSIWQLIAHYQKYDQLDADCALKCAKMFVEYSDNESAFGILQPFLDDEDVLQYALPLMYTHPSVAQSDIVYDFMLQARAKMSSGKWCNAFLNECRIPFQAFDHEELRNIFCAECLGQNDFLIELLSGGK